MSLVVSTRIGAVGVLGAKPFEKSGRLDLLDGKAGIIAKNAIEDLHIPIGLPRAAATLRKDAGPCMIPAHVPLPKYAYSQS